MTSTVTIRLKEVTKNKLEKLAKPTHRTHYFLAAEAKNPMWRVMNGKLMRFTKSLLRQTQATLQLSPKCKR